jgi:uncharacterized damage-inducible protein DinB
MAQVQPWADPSLAFDAFDRNARVNAATLAELNDELLLFPDDTGGYRIGQHLADMVSFRRDWLGRVAPAYAERIDDPTDPARPTWLRARTVRELAQDFDAGDAALRAAVADHLAERRPFVGAYASHPAALLMHCIVHDAHHRGQIATLVRRSGRSEERRHALEERTWSIWRA